MYIYVTKARMPWQHAEARAHAHRAAESSRVILSDRVSHPMSHTPVEAEPVVDDADLPCDSREVPGQAPTTHVETVPQRALC